MLQFEFKTTLPNLKKFQCFFQPCLTPICLWKLIIQHINRNLLAIVGNTENAPLGIVVEYFKCSISPLTSLFRFFTDLLISKKSLLSAKWCTFHCWFALWRSSIQIKKRNGPRTKSCDTPQSTDIKSELYPLMETSFLKSGK